MPEDQPHEDQPEVPRPDRRLFFRSLFAWVPLGLSYGLFGLLALRYLYPSRKDQAQSKMFIAFTSQVGPGKSLAFSTPQGEQYLLTRSEGLPASFKAFSNRCPHLGCKVDWQSDKERFYCPCHAGVFNKDGVPISGPPAKAGQNLKRCDILVEGKSIYAMIGRA